MVTLRSFLVATCGVLVVLLQFNSHVATAQNYRPGGRYFLSDSAISPRSQLAHVRPEVHKFYRPRHLSQNTGVPWYSTDTRYSRQLFRRYVDKDLEGELWYDYFGNPIERGWLLYQWTQEQEHPRGSAVWKTGQYRSLFRNLVVASDSDRFGDYRLLIGDEISTVFTPLTFNKPRFNGLRIDHTSEHYATSLIMSRPSFPNGNDVFGSQRPSTHTNFTNLFGAHVEFGHGAGRLGLTYVNAHHGQTRQRFGEGSPFSGGLTVSQNVPLETLLIRIRDDSPDDDGGGPLLFNYDVVLIDTSGRELRGRDIGFAPTIQGGVARGNNLTADGSESILMTYDMTTLNYDGVESANLQAVRVELSVANDYRIEIASDRQTDAEVRRAQPVFLTAHRAPGNVRDNSNARSVVVDYGLPTANELIGLNWDLVDFRNFSLQGEVVVNRQHRKYPNPDIDNRHHVVNRQIAAYSQAAYRRFPWNFFIEVFSIPDAYSSSAWLSDRNGLISYNDATRSLYEFVDDDDDFNGIPEWQRVTQLSSERAWPGMDENVDFIHDYNQNGNLFPDYEEPFLKFRSDRPEFLPGLDMNYNGTVDRFENDEFPDYPYKPDHRGFNAYGSANVIPDLTVTIGHQHIGLIAGDGRTRSSYALARWTRMLPGGRLRIFDHVARVRDNIADPLRLWVQPAGMIGRMRDVADPLPGRNAWLQSAYADLETEHRSGIITQHRWRWTTIQQQIADTQLYELDVRRTSGFFGLVDRVELNIPVGLAVLKPRWKSEYRNNRPLRRHLPATASLEETVTLIWSQPLLEEHVTVGYFPGFGRQLFSTEFQVGLERSWFRLLKGHYEHATEHFRSWTLLTQLQNRSAYLGYRLVSRLGLEIGRRQFETRPNQHRSLVFATMHVGLN